MAKTINQMIDVMTAFSKGAKIEAMPVTYSHAEWREANAPFWNWDSYDYRVKPEPREYVIAVDSMGYPQGVGHVGSIVPVGPAVRSSQLKLVKVREVL